jgi:hypothetical protein
MSPSAQLISEPQKEIIEDEMHTDQGARVVQEQEDCKGVLDTDNSSSVWSIVLNTINNGVEHQCLDEVVRLLSAHPIRQSTEDHVPGQKYSIPGLPGTQYLAYQVWAVCCIVAMWVWDADMPRAPVTDEMSLGKTFTSVEAEKLCKLMIPKVVMGFPLSILWLSTLEEWAILANNDFPGISGKEGERYPLQRLNSVPCHLLEIRRTAPHGHPALILTTEPILVVKMHGVAETFNTGIDKMNDGSEFKLVYMLHTKNADHTH